MNFFKDRWLPGGRLTWLGRLGLLGLCVIFLVIVSTTTKGHAQTGRIAVEPPYSLSNTETSSVHATLVGDRAGLVHVFWCEDVGGQEVTPQHRGGNGNTLMYAVWDGRGWSDPVDVRVSSQNRRLTSPQADVDANGVLHVVWFEGADRLMYARAHVLQAQFARHWAEPVELDANAGAIEDGADLVAGEPGTLHVLYAGGSRFRILQEPRAVLYVHSTDGGASWSEPTVLMEIPGQDYGASDLRLFLDPAGRLHATWVEWNVEGFGQTVYYTRSLDRGGTWEPAELVDHKDPDKPHSESWRERIIVAGDDAGHLFRFWLTAPPAHWYYQLSTDGGATWGSKSRLFVDLEGDQGPPTLAQDGAGRLHLFIGLRTTPKSQIGRDIRGLWHGEWTGAMWSSPELLGPNERHGNNPKAAIVRGNELVVTWWSHVIAEAIVMMGHIPDAPAVPVQLWSTPSPTPTRAVAPTPTPHTREKAEPGRPVPTPAAQDPQAASRQPATGLILSVGAVVILVGGIVTGNIRRILRKRRRGKRRRRKRRSVVTPENWTPNLAHIRPVQERGHTMTERRTFEPEFKARLVLQELTGVKSAAEICREHNLEPQVFVRWKAEFIERAPEIFATEPSQGDEQERIAELERMVGRLTMELEAAKKSRTS
jgi:transposase